MAWNIRDIFRAIYSRGLLADLQDSGKLVFGVDAAGTYQPITLAAGGGIAVVPSVGQGNTYVSAFTVASAIGHAFEIKPSATKAVQLLEVYISKPTNATVVTLIKQSIADTLGTSTAQTIVPMSVDNPAATATVLAYTAAPTPGTLVGAILIDSMAVSDRVDFNAGNGPDQPVTLKKNTTQSVALNISVAGTITVMLKWLEV